MRHVESTYPPPTIDMIQAPGLITSECASTIGSANPVTTTTEVMKRPRSIGPEPSYEAENSSDPQCEKMAFGKGARTKVSAKMLNLIIDLASNGIQTVHTNKEWQPIGP